MTAPPGAMRVFIFDGPAEEFRAECRRRGLPDGEPATREFYGKIYVGWSAALDGWDRLRPLAPGPFDAEFTTMQEAAR